MTTQHILLCFTTRSHGRSEPKGNCSTISKRCSLYEPRTNIADTVQQFAEQHQREGKDTTVNPFALRNDPLKLAVDKRRRLFEQAIAL